MTGRGCHDRRDVHRGGSAPQIAIVAFVILGYTLLAAGLDRLSVSGSMILVTIGAVLGPSGVGA